MISPGPQQRTGQDQGCTVQQADRWAGQRQRLSPRPIRSEKLSVSEKGDPKASINKVEDTLKSYHSRSLQV